MQQVAVASGPVWTVARSLFGDAQAVLVDVNAGTDEELRRRLLHIPRLPPTVAERIVQLRPFASLPELRDRVRSCRESDRDSIGRSLLRYLTVSDPAAGWADALLADIADASCLADAAPALDEHVPMQCLSRDAQLNRMRAVLRQAGVTVSCADPAHVRTAWKKHKQRIRDASRGKRIRPADDNARRTRQRREQRARSE